MNFTIHIRPTSLLVTWLFGCLTLYDQTLEKTVHQDDSFPFDQCRLNLNLYEKIVFSQSACDHLACPLAYCKLAAIVFFFSSGLCQGPSWCQFTNEETSTDNCGSDFHTVSWQRGNLSTKERYTSHFLCMAPNSGQRLYPKSVKNPGSDQGLRWNIKVLFIAQVMNCGQNIYWFKYLDSM